jgi:uncharacterized protein YegL
MDSMAAIRRLPIYVLADTSGTMEGEPIQQVQVGLKLLVDELTADPATMEVAYLSVITFGDVAQQVVPLTELSAFTAPTITAGGGRAFGDALRTLEKCYDREILKYVSENEKRDFKPIVYVMTDGKPTDEWEQITDDIGKLVRDGRKYAYIVALGMGLDADEAVLRRLTDNVILMRDITPGAMTKPFKGFGPPVRFKSGSERPDDIDGTPPSAPIFTP